MQVVITCLSQLVMVFILRKLLTEETTSSFQAETADQSCEFSVGYVRAYFFTKILFSILPSTF